MQLSARFYFIVLGGLLLQGLTYAIPLNVNVILILFYRISLTQKLLINTRALWGLEQSNAAGLTLLDMAVSPVLSNMIMYVCPIMISSKLFDLLPCDRNLILEPLKPNKNVIVRLS